MPCLPPSLDMSCFLPSACPVRQQFSNKCNDTVSLWLLLFYNSLSVFSNSCNENVPLWCEGLIHPSSFGKIICQYEKTEVFFLLDSVPNKGHQCRCQQLTIVRQRFSSQFLCSSKVRSMSSVSSQCWWLLKMLKPGRHLRPCVRKILQCWCCCVTTTRQPLWLRLRFAARMSKACSNASIPNKSITFSRILEFCSASRDISPTSLWMEVVGSKSLGVAAAAFWLLLPREK